MQKTTLLSVLAVLCLLGNLHLTTLQAQNTAIQPLTIGDTVPDIEFTNMVNYHKPTARLSDFKGKLVILDFWATWCGPCVKGLPLLSELQQKYAHQLAVIPISDENAAGVKNFLARRSNIHLPSAIITAEERKRIKQWLPYTTVPHTVIISQQGKVMALTTSGFITDSLIELALNNQPVQLPVKKELPSYNRYAHFLINNNAGVKTGDIAFQSLITRYLSGPGGTRHTPVYASDMDKTRIGFHITNLPIAALAANALGLPMHYYFTRLVLEQIKDTTRYIKGNAGTEWYLRNNYCYEIIMPEATVEQMRLAMKADIDRYFKIESSIQKRELPCMVIQKLYNKAIAIDTGYGSSHSKADSAVFKNLTVNKLAEMLELQLSIPVLNETGSTVTVNFTLPSYLAVKFRNNRSNLKQLIDWFSDQGFIVAYTLRTVDALVIKENFEPPLKP